MIRELWKDIDEFKGIYQISNRGRVKRLHRIVKINNKNNIYERELREKILIPTEDKDGYLVIGLLGKNRKIHRLVAKAFIPNPFCFPQVNHKDGNKKNNNVENLEWCSNLYNQIHAFKIGLKKTKKYAKINCNDNRIVDIYNSLNDAKMKNPGVDVSLLVKVCRNKRKQHFGFRWCYANDDMKVGDIVDRACNSC